ncbi:MAG: cation:proton antiporter [Acidimicrobiia bacterium]|nr:cation:proton antiporter [Acidimicrobiia bacterium]
MDHGLNTEALAVVSGCVIAWGLVSARFARLQITAPIAFAVMGLAVTHGPVTLIHIDLRSSTVRQLAEITLAVVLFCDASRVNVRALLADAALPARLLGIGLPLTIGFGTAVAAALFSGSGLWVAAAVAAILAPTDAALGAAIMQDERVPGRVRRLLNVESGLNDGIATPFVNLFLAGALASEAIHGSGPGGTAVDLLGGAALGAGIGAAGGALLVAAQRAGWSAAGFRQLAVLALALFAYACALETGTNGFVAAFVAGMGFGSVIADDQLLTFAEETSVLLSLLVWFVFGALMVVPGFQAAGWRDVVFAVLALTVVRMGPVALALTGSGLGRATVAFIGWFGPRGLASVVFGLIAYDSLAPAEAHTVIAVVTVTVALSVVAHGVTASPFARRYGKIADGLHRVRPEHATTPALPTRALHGHR